MKNKYMFFDILRRIFMKILSMRRGTAESTGIGRKLLSWGLTAVMILGVNVCAFPVAAHAADVDMTVDEERDFDVVFPCTCETPSKANWTVTYDSDYIKLASMDQAATTGTFHARKDGTATINFSCSACNESHSYEIAINDTIPNELGLSLSQTSLTLTAGQTGTTTATWTDNTADPAITWSSSKASVATVSGSGANGKKGTITAVAAGTATITAKDSVSGEEATCTVTVEAAPVYNDKIIFTEQPGSATYKVDASAKALKVSAKANISGTDTTMHLTYQWYKGSSKSSVNSAISGAVGNSYTPRTSSEGTTYYKCVVTYDYNGVTVSGTSSVASVTVNESSSRTNDDYSVTVDTDTSTLGPDEEATLTVKVYDDNDKLVKSNYTVKWSSNYPKIISLEDKTTKLKSGKSTNKAICDDDNDENKSVTITATVEIDDYTYSDTVKIKATDEADNKYGITLSANNSTLSKGGSTVLTATITKNGSTYKSGKYNVDWTIRTGRGYATLEDTTTKSSEGKATNVLYVPNNLTGSGTQSVSVEAEVRIDGKDYSRTKAININLPGNTNVVPTPVNPTNNTNINTNTNTGKVNIVLQVDNPTMVSNGNPVTKDVAPIIVNNRTMVPIRHVTEMLGGAAYWDNDTRMVTLSLNGKVMNMTIGTTIPGYDVAPFILNDRTYVPIRYISETIGYNVQWVDATRQILITG